MFSQFEEVVVFFKIIHQGFKGAMFPYGQHQETKSKTKKIKLSGGNH